MSTARRLPRPVPHRLGRPPPGLWAPAAAGLRASAACGRIGYDLLPAHADDAGAAAHEDASRQDATTRDDGAVDALEGGVDDATLTDAGEASATPSGDEGDVSVPAEGGGDATADDAESEAAADAGDAGVTADAACVTSAIVDYCSALPSLPAPPVIDGRLDCGPALLPIVPVSWTGPGVVPAGNSAKLAAAWRPDGLYVFVEVTDPELIPADNGDPPWYGDGAEIYVDNDGLFPNSPAYDTANTTVQLVTEAPATATSTSQIAETYRAQNASGPWTSTTFEAFGTPTGYVLEAFVTAPDLDLTTWALAPNQNIGFDIAVNVSYPSTTPGTQGHRLGQYFLFVAPPPAGGPYVDVRSFCTPTLQ